MLPRTLLCCLVATCVLAACERNPTHGAPSSAAAATAAAGDAAEPPAVAASAAAPATSSGIAMPANAQTAPSPGDDGSDAPSASLAGVAHDADPDPALLRDLFALPGPITADTEPDGLRRIYGAANVKQGEVPGGEGETSPGVILFPDDPKHRAYVYFQNGKTLTGLSMVRIMDEGSQWHSAQGIRIGTSMAELVRINGGPFVFSGFDWDYGGTVTDWLSGKLAPTKGGMILRVALAPGDQPKGMSMSKLPIGDGSFRSDLPSLAKMKATVADMSLSFPGLDDQ